MPPQPKNRVSKSRPSYFKLCASGKRNGFARLTINATRRATGSWQYYGYSTISFSARICSREIDRVLRSLAAPVVGRAKILSGTTKAVQRRRVSRSGFVQIRQGSEAGLV